MIRLHLTNEAFEQDIRPLYMSFFPKEEYVFSYGGKPVNLPYEPADWGRYLLYGEWKEDGFVLSLYRNGDLSDAVQQEEKTVPLTERKKFRDEVKRAVYRMLSAETGKELPWGTLTGVRPVKQVLERAAITYCPHGRPVITTLTKKQLEKQFKRA